MVLANVKNVTNQHESYCNIWIHHFLPAHNINTYIVKHYNLTFRFGGCKNLHVRLLIHTYQSKIGQRICMPEVELSNLNLACAELQFQGIQGVTEFITRISFQLCKIYYILESLTGASGQIEHYPSLLSNHTTNRYVTYRPAVSLGRIIFTT